jgi:uncharacterized glyoxalase superfamily protein PhnB
MATITRATWVLAVEDLSASKAFYIEKLGFQEEMNAPGWAFLKLGECRLRIGDCPGILPMHQASDHSWVGYLHVDSARELYEQYLSKGVSVWGHLEDKPWGLREFGIVTPDGHRWVFGEIL